MGAPEAPPSKGFKEEGCPGCPMKPGQQEGRQVEVPIRIHYPASQVRRLCPQTHSSHGSCAVLVPGQQRLTPPFSTFTVESHAQHMSTPGWNKR